jgi:glycosyltransferase involved in cell wall biosynthesis
MSSVCLAMIVKNEAHVLARCLASLKPLIDAWVIVDTGSTDGTQDVARAALAGVPGEVHERPWVDFAHNRNEALALARAKADYLLVMDADDLLEVPIGYRLPALTADAYRVRIEYQGTTYHRIQLFRANIDYRYVGVLHEVLISDGPRTEETLVGLVCRITTAGARSRNPHKFKEDAAVLEAALQKEPDNARYAFYLGQSYRDAEELERARAAYERRAKMPGFEEETWYAMLEVSKLSVRLGRSDDEIVGAYLRAFERRPTRAESMCYLAMALRERGRPAAAYPFARAAADTPYPSDILFVDESVYAWRALDELVVAAYWSGRYREGALAAERLLASGKLPPAHRARVEKNLAFCREKLGPGA